MTNKYLEKIAQSYDPSDDEDDDFGGDIHCEENRYLSKIAELNKEAGLLGKLFSSAPKKTLGEVAAAKAAAAPSVVTPGVKRKAIPTVQPTIPTLAATEEQKVLAAKRAIKARMEGKGKAIFTVQ